MTAKPGLYSGFMVGYLTLALKEAQANGNDMQDEARLFLRSCAGRGETGTSSFPLAAILLKFHALLPQFAL